MDINNDYGCFIRRPDGNGWVRAQPHHRVALEAFLEKGEEGPTWISVPHTFGGVFGGAFVATFYRDGEGMYRYQDEYGRSIQVMMANASYAAYINRIVDY
jgi:hypothetical protein